jgi:hypothetical protein
MRLRLTTVSDLKAFGARFWFCDDDIGNIFEGDTLSD